MFTHNSFTKILYFSTKIVIMKKAKVILGALVVLSFVGGALAFKAK